MRVGSLGIDVKEEAGYKERLELFRQACHRLGINFLHGLCLTIADAERIQKELYEF